MSQKNQSRDLYSGIPWVDVTPEQARAHPLGKPGLLIWAIAVYFLFIAGLKFYLSMSYDTGIGVALLNAIWPFLAAIGLLLRVPWSVFMAIVSAALTVYALMRGMGSDGSLIYLAETLANVGILFYLIDGDRPNLIYRHRYRKYSVEESHDDG